MAKIPFTLDAWLKDKSQRVETRDGSHVVETISVDLTRDSMRVMANFGNNRIVHYYDDGRFWKNANSDNDLFIITPEPEFTEFDLKLLDWLSSDTCGEIPMEKMKECVKNRASELLELARKECETAFGNAREYLRGRNDGMQEALKDLPRWKKADGKERFNERLIVLAGDNDLLCTNYAEEGEYYLPFHVLENLPKED